MTLPELKQALDHTGVIPSRKLGQNFLHDANVARWISEQLNPQPHDCVVEVGPGTGALSEHLIGKVKKLILIEYDQRLAEYLTERFADEPSVEVHSADGARFDTRVLWTYGSVKMLGNLPYSAGGAILRNFLKSPTPITMAVIMLQKEVIDRIIAEPRTKAYGVLSLRMQSEWDSAPIKTIGPECFHPRPLIDSTVMKCMRSQDDLPVFNRRLFDELIRRGFSQRRKMLRKAMPSTPPWSQVAMAVDCTETTRAEELSLPQWVTLTRAYDETLKDPAQNSDELFDVVDENDEVIAQNTRQNVHAEGLRHRAVHLFLVNGKSEILLQQRSRLKDIYPEKWGSSASGHVDHGENYEDAIRREVQEELGVDPAHLDFKTVGKLPPSVENGQEFITLYIAAYSGSLRTRTNEVAATLWFGQEELDLWLTERPEDFSDGFLECWNLLKTNA